MDSSFSIELDRDKAFRQVAAWADREPYFAFYLTSLDRFEAGLGAVNVCRIEHAKGSFEKLRAFQLHAHSRVCGYLGYDLKNDLERLDSKRPLLIDFPEAVFFIPKISLNYIDGRLTVTGLSAGEFDLFRKQLESEISAESKVELFDLEAEISREVYLSQVEKLKSHLHRGDIYEANYCMAFRGQSKAFHPLSAFLHLQQLTEAPFSVFAKLDEQYVISASPERFLKKTADTLISQPIKGTRKRSEDRLLDVREAQLLLNDAKERSENVMIVDLVRNDLSRVAQRSSVRVDRLFEIQSFKTVHHLVSTIACQIDERFDHWDALKACFPMGSMTGAPKIRAMELIEETEHFKRGPYSGAFGWIDANGDFDFNVLIRSLFYDRDSGALAMAVGSAITLGSDPAKEYEECMLKAAAVLQSLKIGESLESARLV